MDFTESLDRLLSDICNAGSHSTGLLDRITAEIEFARSFVELHPDMSAEWQGLILRAAELLKQRLSSPEQEDMAALVTEAETILQPIGEVAKQYIIHCCGHAHIDMNWMWPWHETISVTRDTFSTVDRLMDEFPDFRFSQSQASTYMAMQEYCPEVFEMIKKRMSEGRWETTASMWVECDKNLPSGESFCRQILYTKRYFKEQFGIPYDALKIDWSPDAFGHTYTLPSILSRGGVNRYYHSRTGPYKWLVWWQGPDGSKVLLFLDKAGYNGSIEPGMVNFMIDYVKETGLKDFLYVYGVGDHGGGPTRKDLRRAQDMMSWPIFPTLRFSTTDTYFNKVEESQPDLPVFDGELNAIFEGCYTSQSNIKLANRVSESILPELEAVSVVAMAMLDVPYPSEEIGKAWRMTMFNQFHDILPGSGVHATYEHAQGFFQEIQALALSCRTRSLRSLADRVNTKAAFGSSTSGTSSLGAGAGDHSITGGVSSWSPDDSSPEPFVVFNSLAYPWSEIVETKVWNREIPSDRVIVRDSDGNCEIGQVIKSGDYWGHKYTSILFPARDIQGMGYKTYAIDTGAKWDWFHEDVPCGWFPPKDPEPGEVRPGEVRTGSEGVIENSLLRIEIDSQSGAIKHLIDKSTGYDLVPEGSLMGVLELYQEVPHGMSSWTIGRTQRMMPLLQDGIDLYHAARGIRIEDDPFFLQSSDYVKKGPQRASIRIGRRLNKSIIIAEIGLDADSPVVDIRITAEWREMGDMETGVPMLRMAFPVRVNDPEATYQIPFGSISRPVDGSEVPALQWADMSGLRLDGGGTGGITVLNNCKYGHSADDNTLRVTLIRSSYDPDPLPEMGRHEIHLAIMPHDGKCQVSSATKAAAGLNTPMNVISTGLHEGDLPASNGCIEIENSNIMLSSIKKAEDSDAIVLRLYDMEGIDTKAMIKLPGIVKENSRVTETDLLEQPIQNSHVHMEGDTLIVDVPAHGISTVQISQPV